MPAGRTNTPENPQVIELSGVSSFRLQLLRQNMLNRGAPGLIETYVNGDRGDMQSAKLANTRLGHGNCLAVGLRLIRR